MVRRIRGHLCRKCDSREIELITAWLEVGDRICCAIQFSHDCRRRLGRLTQVHSGSEAEVEESRRPPLPAVSAAVFPPAMNIPSPALSILASPSSATSVDPDIW